MKTIPIHDCTLQLSGGRALIPIGEGRRKRAEVRRRASKSETLRVLLFALNLDNCLKLKQKVTEHVMENQPSAGLCTCSPIPTTSTLSPSSCSQSILTPYKHNTPSMWSDFLFASENQDPQLPALPPFPLTLPCFHHHPSGTQDLQEPTAPVLLPVPHFTLFCFTISSVVPGTPALLALSSPIPFLSSSLYLTSKENYPVQTLYFNTIHLTLRPPKVLFLTVSPPGNYTPRSPQGHPNSRHKHMLFSDSFWACAYNIPQLIYSLLLNSSHPHPPKATFPKKASPNVPWLKGILLSHKGFPVALIHPTLLQDTSNVSTLHVDKHMFPSSVVKTALHLFLPHTETNIGPIT